MARPARGSRGSPDPRLGPGTAGRRGPERSQAPTVGTPCPQQPGSRGRFTSARAGESPLPGARPEPRPHHCPDLWAAPDLHSCSLSPCLGFQDPSRSWIPSCLFGHPKDRTPSDAQRRPAGSRVQPGPAPRRTFPPPTRAARRPLHRPSHCSPGPPDPRWPHPGTAHAPEEDSFTEARGLAEAPPAKAVLSAQGLRAGRGGVRRTLTVCGGRKKRSHCS